MNYSKSNKKKLLIEKSKAKHYHLYSFTEHNSSVGFDHIKGKNICLNCNASPTIGKCCNRPTYYYLGKIARTPRKKASRNAWKKFYIYLSKNHRNFSRDYPEILKKYNISDI